MKTKQYKNGTGMCTAYVKPVGNGYEAGFKFKGKPLFVGNFVKSKEANQWWTLMNKEIRTFSKRYKVGKTFPESWYKHFVSTHLYHKYYTFVGKCLNRNERETRTSLRKDTRKYKVLTRKWTPKEKRPALKAA